MTGPLDPASDSVLPDGLLGTQPKLQLNGIEEQLEKAPEVAQRLIDLNPQHQLTGSQRVVANAEKDADCVGWQNSTAELQSTVISAPADHSATMIGVPPATEDLQPPAFLASHPRYRILRLLGVGGMGRVWLAQHTVMGRQVALKVMRSSLLSDRKAAERFLREVQAAAKLNHPNIASAYDADKVDDTYLLVMEYVPGKTLAELVRENPLSAPDACRAIRDAAAGLAHAHAAGLVHRDVKPGNLIQTLDGTVKVLDFGLVFSQDSEISITGQDLIMGTPDYIAPEQAEDAHNADARSDIYSLGCTMYHLLSGRPPFAGESILKKLDSHRTSSATVVESIPKALSDIMFRMMARDPDARFQSAGEVVAALEPWCHGREPKQPTEPTGVAVSPVQPKSTKRRIVAVAGILLALVTTAVLAIALRNSGKDDAADSERLSPTQPRRIALRLPAGIDKEAEKNLVIENDVLHLKTYDDESQLWMDYNSYVGTEVGFHGRFQILRIDRYGFLKFAFLSAEAAEINVQISIKEMMPSVKIEQWTMEGVILTEETVSVAFGRELTELRIALQGTTLKVWINGEERLSCHIDEKRLRYLAIAAKGADVDVHDPVLTIQ